MEKISRSLFYIYRNWYYVWVELSGWKGSVSYGLGADLSLPSCLSVAIGIWTLAQKSDHGPKSRGKSFGTTLWHHVQRYCSLGVLFAHAQLPSNSNSYHIRGVEMNCVESSEYMTMFTSFTRASFLNMYIGHLVFCWSERRSQNRPFCIQFASL